MRHDAEEGDGEVVAADAVVVCDQGDELGKGSVSVCGWWNENDIRRTSAGG